MPSTPTTTHLSDALEAIAAAAADHVRATAESDAPDVAAIEQRVRESAAHAIAAGEPLAQIAAAEQHGQAQARQQLAPEILKAIAKAARRKRDAEHDYEREIHRAGRLGLAHREIATAAEVTHGTIRAILTRTHDTDPEPPPPSSNGHHAPGHNGANGEQ